MSVHQYIFIHFKRLPWDSFCVFKRMFTFLIVNIYVSTEQGKVLNTVECFDFKEKKWSNIAPMIIARKMVGSAVLDGQLYAVGGVNTEYADLVTVECFSPCTGQWTSVASLNKCKGMNMDHKQFRSSPHGYQNVAHVY